MMTGEIYYAWEEIDNDIFTLAKTIKSSGFSPDLIIGIARGGCVPAIMLSHLLRKPFDVLKWSIFDYKNTDLSNWLKFICEAKYGIKILLMEDIVDTGETLSILFKYAEERDISQKWKENLKIASIWCNPRAKILPNFFVKEIDREFDQRWVVFPWEKREEIK